MNLKMDDNTAYVIIVIAILLAVSIEGHPIECKPGDIFPVPVGYEFKKEGDILRIIKKYAVKSCAVV